MPTFPCSLHARVPKVLSKPQKPVKASESSSVCATQQQDNEIEMQSLENNGGMSVSKTRPSNHPQMLKCYREMILASRSRKA